MDALGDYKFQIDPDTLKGSIVMPTMEKVAADVATTIASDHNGKVRAALIALGWTPPGGVDAQALAERFARWPLPKSVCSDLCATERDYKYPRSGTNLMTVDEARQMFEYLFPTSQ